MAIVDYTTGVQPVAELGHRVMKAENKVDFSVVAASSGDVCQVLDIPAEAKVNRVDAVIVTAEGAAVTGTLGDGTTPNGWDASVSANGAAGTLTSSQPGVDTYGYGKFYPTTDTIDFVVGVGGLDTAVIIFTAEYTLIERYAVT